MANSDSDKLANGEVPNLPIFASRSFLTDMRVDEIGPPAALIFTGRKLMEVFEIHREAVKEICKGRTSLVG
jgi:hypothetical protein